MNTGKTIKVYGSVIDNEREQKNKINFYTKNMIRFVKQLRESIRSLVNRLR